MSIGRNDQCPCGSGRKAKKCHPESVGRSSAVFGWYLDMRTFIESCDGYMPPMSDDERRAWKQTGCPHGDCTYGTDEGVPCAAGCGV